MPWKSHLTAYPPAPNWEINEAVTMTMTMTMAMAMAMAMVKAMEAKAIEVMASETTGKAKATGRAMASEMASETS